AADGYPTLAADFTQLEGLPFEPQHGLGPVRSAVRAFQLQVGEERFERIGKDAKRRRGARGRIRRLECRGLKSQVDRVAIALDLPDAVTGSGGLRFTTTAASAARGQNGTRQRNDRNDRRRSRSRVCQSRPLSRRHVAASKDVQSLSNVGEIIRQATPRDPFNAGLHGVPPEVHERAPQKSQPPRSARLLRMYSMLRL